MTPTEHKRRIAAQAYTWALVGTAVWVLAVVVNLPEGLWR